MPRQLVEVIGLDGHAVERHVVEIAHGGCIDAEFEEVALPGRTAGCARPNVSTGAPAA